MRQELLRESDVQLSVRRLLESVGYHCYALSQGRATRQSAGLPDLYGLHPTKGAVWVECKRPGGTLSEAQILFADRCAQSGVGYLCCSSLEAAHAFLWTTGLLLPPLGKAVD